MIGTALWASNIPSFAAADYGHSDFANSSSSGALASAAAKEEADGFIGDLNFFAHDSDDEDEGDDYDTSSGSSSGAEDIKIREFAPGASLCATHAKIGRAHV